jgi:hypothetical protein
LQSCWRFRAIREALDGLFQGTIQMSETQRLLCILWACYHLRPDAHLTSLQLSPSGFTEKEQDSLRNRFQGECEISFSNY